MNLRLSLLSVTKQLNENILMHVKTAWHTGKRSMQFFNILHKIDRKKKFLCESCSRNPLIYPNFMYPSWLVKYTYFDDGANILTISEINEISIWSSSKVYDILKDFS